MGEAIAAVAGVIGTILVSIISYIMARRAGIGPFQDTLVSKLKDIVDIQQVEIESLKTKNISLDDRIDELEKALHIAEGTILELKELTVKQALLIEKLSNPRRKRVAPIVEDEEE